MEKTPLEALLKARFDANGHRHRDITWKEVVSRLEARPEAWKALSAMEETGGEPDVGGRDPSTGSIVFYDFAAETPAGRRSLCFDRAALEARKANKPAGCAQDQAAELGAEILTEEEYRHLQTLEEFDLKTSSWIETPADVRNRGGALFCDRRYGRVFTYHNGADSYYGVRGWRGKVRV